MKMLRVAVLFILTALLAAAKESADDAVPTQGTMRIMPKGDEKEAVDLPLKHTEVTAEISGLVTRVKVVQTFTNPYKDPIEAIYVFPLPQNAAVSDMQIRIGDRVIKGLIKKREEARQIYEDAKKAGKTAALLDQERPNIFTQSVANIMPGSDILVEITYDEVLKYEKGGYEFAFPMVVGPRFIPGTPNGQQADGLVPRSSQSGGGWSEDTDQVPDASRITPPVLKPGERNGHDINVVVKLNAGLAIRSLQSPSHDVTAAGEQDKAGVYPGPVEVRLKPHDTIPNKDFVLRYEVAGPAPEIGVLVHKGELGGYFMLMFQPPEQPAPETVTPKEMVFVMDCSGSMSGEPIALSKKAVRYALQNLNPDDTFQIIRFSEAASPFSPEPLPNTPENVRRGLSYINGLQGEGGTMMIEGIKAALDYPHRENRLRIVCFMTDGYIGNEAEILHALEKKLGDNTRLFSFGVGSSVNRYLLERMGEVGKGEVQYVLLNEKPEETVRKFYERVRNPVLTHIRVDWSDLDVSGISPARIKDLFVGQPIFVLGRFDRAGSATVKVHAKVGGKDVSYDIPVSLPGSAPENGALAALWARRRIEELMGEQYGGEDKDVVGKVTDLALKYRLMSQYTSFVAVEEKVVNEGGEVKTVQVPVEMPEGVSYEGVFGRDEYADAVGGAPASMIRLGGGRAFSFGGFAAKRAVAPQPMLVAMEADVPAPEPATPVEPFMIELLVSTDGIERVISIEVAGDVWVKEVDASTQTVKSRILARRLHQTELRELWSWLSKALESETPAEIAHGQPGKLTIRLLDDGGAVAKEISIGLTPSAAASESWQKVIEIVLNGARS